MSKSLIYKPDETKSGLKKKNKKLKQRVSLLESFFNSKNIALINSLKRDNSEHLKLFLVCESHVFEVIGKLEDFPEQHPLHVKLKFSYIEKKQDSPDSTRVFDSESGVKNSIAAYKKRNKISEEIEVPYKTHKYINFLVPVNVFFSREEAVKHVEDNEDSYNNAIVREFYPIENEEIENIIFTYKNIGEKYLGESVIADNPVEFTKIKKEHSSLDKENKNLRKKLNEIKQQLNKKNVQISSIKDKMLKILEG